MRVQKFAAACFALFSATTAAPVPPPNAVSIDPNTKWDFSGMLRTITVYFPPSVPDETVSDAAWFIKRYPNCRVNEYIGPQPSNGIDDKAFITQMSVYAQRALLKNLGPTIPVAFVEKGRVEGSYCPQGLTCDGKANTASE